MNSPKWHGLVLSVYATTRGFAYTLFEGPLSPVDWGVREIRSKNKNARCLKSITRLIETHQPDALVIEDWSEAGSRRSSRIRRLYRAVEAWAENQSIDTYRYSRNLIRETFSNLGALTKQEIAEVIAKHIPAFDHRLPPIRRPWMSEDPRMGLFDAAALTFTFFRSVETRRVAA